MTRPGSRLGLPLLSGLVLALAACGGPAASKPGAATPAPRPLPPIPSEPLLLVPADASGVVSIKLSELRSSSIFTLLNGYLQRQPCFAPDREQALLSRLDHVLFAYTERDPSAPEERFIALAKGPLAADDERLLLDTLGKRDAPPATESKHSRFVIWTRGDLASSRLAADLVAIGTRPALESVLAIADDGSRPRFVDGELLNATGVNDALQASSFALVARPNERMVKRSGRSLGSIGLPRDLLAGALALTAKLHEQGLDLAGRVIKASPDDAQHAAATLNRKLGQLGLLARIAGLPPVLDHTQVTAEAARLQASVTISTSELDALRDRLAELLETVPSPCATESLASVGSDGAT